MTSKYSEVAAFFRSDPLIPHFAHQKSSKLILSTDYSNPQIWRLLLLKTADHIPTFKTVMEPFAIEMVKH
jgi:hypothetical protein